MTEAIFFKLVRNNCLAAFSHRTALFQSDQTLRNGNYRFSLSEAQRRCRTLTHTLCLRKEPQPERSTSQHGKETPQLLPCSESPTPPSAHVWPCCYGHCTQPPPLADHPHCGYKSEHLFLKNTKAITSWCSNTYSTIIYIICTTYINIPYCTMWLQGATNDEKAQEGFKCQRHLLLGLDWVFILEMKDLIKITKRGWHHLSDLRVQSRMLSSWSQRKTQNQWMKIEHLPCRSLQGVGRDHDVFMFCPKQPCT